MTVVRAGPCSLSINAGETFCLKKSMTIRSLLLKSCCKYKTYAIMYKFSRDIVGLRTEYTELVELQLYSMLQRHLQENVKNKFLSNL
jgi:hypothetical protein